MLSSGKCAANEIEVLNQICSAWVIECCFEERACLYVRAGEETRTESLCRKAGHVLSTRDDKDCKKLIRYSVLVEDILGKETGQKRLLGDFLY